MFDIGFTELLLVGIVALIVVGPERLPSLIRTTLGYVRQFKSSFSHMKSEVERELELNELKNNLADNKNKISQAVGYDDLQDSWDELRQETDEIKNLGRSPFDTSTSHDEVSDAEIEADLDNLVEGPQLPNPDAEAETGIESESSDASQTATKAAKKTQSTA